MTERNFVKGCLVAMALAAPVWWAFYELGRWAMP